jgi:hypothetical protein
MAHELELIIQVDVEGLVRLRGHVACRCDRTRLGNNAKAAAGSSRARSLCRRRGLGPIGPE